MKTYATTAEIPARFAFAARPMFTEGPYRAFASYKAALAFAAKKTTPAQTLVRRFGSTKNFTAIA